LVTRKANQDITKVLNILEELTQELYPQRSSPVVELNTVLDAGLGIDSLARMELLYRLERSLDLNLDENKVLGAITVSDLIETCSTADSKTWSDVVTSFKQEKVSRKSAHQGFPDNAQSLVDALEWHKDSQPDNPAIYYYEGEIDSPVIITYKNLWDQAYIVAAGLRNKGVLPGQSVALMLPTGKEFLFSFFGILMAGAVAVPIYPPFRLAQIEEHIKRQINILENSETVVMISAQEAKKVGQYLKARLPNIKDVYTFDELQISREAAVIKRSPEDTAFMQYTSGSTGNPKGVVLTHANLLANIRAMGKALHVKADDVFVSWLPLYHDMGLIGAFLGSLYHGFPLVLMPPLSFIARPYRWLQAISRHQASFSAGPNFAYEISTSKIRDEDISNIDLSSLRVLCNGAEPIYYKTMQKFIERFKKYRLNPQAMAPVYGLAESSVGLCFPPIGRGPKIDIVDIENLHKKNRATPVDSDNQNATHIVACGYPLAEHEIRIVDHKQRELVDREIGLLQFRGPSTTQGYYRNAEANAGLFCDSWLNSGDYAYIVEGEVYITGRQKDLIIRAGRNIYPYELEQAIGEIEGIRMGNVAVFASNDLEKGTEKLVVLAESRVRDTLKREQIQQQINEITVALAHLPADEIILAPLRTVLKTSSGKIRRNECRALYESGHIGKSKSVYQQFIGLGASALLPFIKRAVRSTGEKLYVLYTCTLSIISAIALWPVMMLIPGRAIPIAILKGTVRTLFFLSGIAYKVVGKEYLPKNQPCILVANHMSYLDVFALGLALPANYGFVAKKELERHWPIRILLLKMNTLFVERFDIQKSVEDSDKILAATKQGESMVFYPEGTFTRAPGLRQFKLGAFVTAANANLPILPVAIKNTRSILRGGDWRPRPGAITITFSPLIYPKETGWDEAVRLRNQARQQILKYCGEPDIAQ